MAPKRGKLFPYILYPFSKWRPNDFDRAIHLEIVFVSHKWIKEYLNLRPAETGYVLPLQIV